jgi:hypothetical protein
MDTLLTKIDDLIASLVIPPVIEEAKKCIAQYKAKLNNGFVLYFPLLSRLRYYNSNFEVPCFIAEECVRRLKEEGIRCKFSRNCRPEASWPSPPYNPGTTKEAFGYNVIYDLDPLKCGRVAYWVHWLEFN